MGWLQRIPSREIAFVAALVASAGAVGWLSGRTAVLPELARPGWEMLQALVSSMRGGATYLRDLETLRKDNAYLRAKLNQAESELVRKVEVDAENKRLSQILAYKPLLGEASIAARIIARSPDNWHQRLVINRGRSSGVGVDSVVTSPRGLVGRVTGVSAHTALVSLVTDPGNAISILNQRSRSPGIAMGEGKPAVVMRYLPEQVDYRVGDLLVTSGLNSGTGQVYPKGLVVARVTRVVQQPNAITPNIQALPAADLDRLEEVLVIPPLNKPLFPGE